MIADAGHSSLLDLRVSPWWPAPYVSTPCLAYRLRLRTPWALSEDLGLKRCEVSFAAAAGAASLWAQRVRRLRHLGLQASKEEQTPDLKVQLPYDLSEEELLSFELADQDFSLCEEEEEEWRQYDEEVSQFKKLVLECGSDPTSSSSRSSSSARLAQIRASAETEDPLGAGFVGDSCSEALLQNKPREDLHSQNKFSSSVPGPLINGQFELPGEYRQRLEESEDAGVVVTTRSGANALVWLSHVPDQPQLLPVVSDTFRTLRVKPVRGWMETMDNGVVIGAFEVSDLNGQPLSSERTAQLETALMQAGERGSHGKARLHSAPHKCVAACKPLQARNGRSFDDTIPDGDASKISAS